jgi:hypothetical protein
MMPAVSQTMYSIDWSENVEGSVCGVMEVSVEVYLEEIMKTTRNFEEVGLAAEDRTIHLSKI